jgi:hypothetical protein
MHETVRTSVATGWRFIGSAQGFITNVVAPTTPGWLTEPLMHPENTPNRLPMLRIPAVLPLAGGRSSLVPASEASGLSLELSHRPKGGGSTATKEPGGGLVPTNAA